MRPRFQFGLRNLLWAMFWFAVWGASFSVLHGMRSGPISSLRWSKSLWAVLVVVSMFLVVASPVVAVASLFRSSERGNTLDRNGALVGIVAATFLAILSWLTISPGTPQVFAPLNLAVLVPAFILGEAVFDEDTAINAVCAIVPLLFYAWCFPIIAGRVTVPTRSIVLLAILITLSALHLGLGYRYGIKYQSVAYVVTVTVINAVCWAALIVVAFLAVRRPSWHHNLRFHVLLFGWLAWYAFPYMGELP